MRAIGSLAPTGGRATLDRHPALRCVTVPASHPGLGQFKERSNSYALPDGTRVELAVKSYEGEEGAFVLEQRLPHGCAHTQARRRAPPDTDLF